MASSPTIQAAPAALDGFGTDARKRGHALASAAGANRARLLGVSRRLDGFAVADQLTAAYPAHARQALQGVDDLAGLLTELGRVVTSAAEHFRQADATAPRTGN